MKRSFALALFVCTAINALSATTAGTEQPVTSRQEISKAVARRVLEEILSQGRFEVADEIYARDFVNHGLHRNADLEEDQAAARWERQIAPDLKMTVELMVAEGDLVTLVWTARGTNTARIGWLPATGVRFEEPGITVWRIVDGKIHDEWTSFDDFQLAVQVATQLKWQLMGLLLLLSILAWMVMRLFRRKFAATVRM